jgi:kumamolisin
MASPKPQQERKMDKTPLAGSERQPLAGATLLGPSDPNERTEITLVLRHNALGALQDRVQRLTRGDYSLAPLTRSAYAAAHGALPGDIEAVKTFATGHNLTVVSVDAARRAIVLSGKVGDFASAFDVTLDHYAHDGGTYRGRTGAVHLPAALTGIVTAVMGLDNRPQARAHLRVSPAAAQPAPAPAAQKTAAVSYTPVAVADLYQFPAGTGAGQTIGIIELGGGTTASDLATYFASLNLPVPKLVTVSVDHGLNQATGSLNGPDGEVMLDVEVAGAVAPGATLVTYFAPNTSAGFLDAVTTAIQDDVNKPTVISISWGSAEQNWTSQAQTAFDEAFQEAVALGLTVCVASGDNGSGDSVNDGQNHVDFPASSPHVLACGGTSLRANGGLMIVSETVWNDAPQGSGATGGGISSVFAAPSWQEGLSATLTAGGSKIPLTKRGVPDVSGNADPQTGYQVRVDGTNTVIGGTSAVAPLWAALIARLNSTRTNGPIGFINPLLYSNPHALHDITQGNNGAYKATPKWDSCTGLGSPNGTALAALFSATTNISHPSNKEVQTMSDKTPENGTTKPNEVIAHGNEVIAHGNEVIAHGNEVIAHGNDQRAKPVSGQDESTMHSTDKVKA